jgi:hypothetical protein
MRPVFHCRKDGLTREGGYCTSYFSVFYIMVLIFIAIHTLFFYTLVSWCSFIYIIVHPLFFIYKYFEVLICIVIQGPVSVLFEILYLAKTTKTGIAIQNKKEKIQTHNITVYCKSILLAYIN